jgi:hypothetical protein
MGGLLREEKGSQLLEFIFLFPLFWVLLVFGFDQFTLFYNRQKALAAAYEAGRIACVQPNYGLARYHAERLGLAELKQAIGFETGEVEVVTGGKWRKGNHIESRVSLRFRLFSSREPYEIKESYTMMIENGEEDG